MFERIQFNNISKPSDLTIWYTDDNKDERNNLLEWLSERLPEGVNFEAGAHGDNLNQKLHEKEEAGSLTKHNIFISGGSVKFETTDWEAKPSSTQVRDNYHGSLDVIKDHEPQLLGQGGHYYTAVYSQAFANNPMLISLDNLIRDGWLNLNDVKSYPKTNFEKVDYPRFEKFKQDLLTKAAANFEETKKDNQKFDFENYCEKNQYWLNDYALFCTFQNFLGEQQWIKWPKSFRTSQNYYLCIFSDRHQKDSKQYFFVAYHRQNVQE